MTVRDIAESENPHGRACGAPVTLSPVVRGGAEAPRSSSRHVLLMPWLEEKAESVLHSLRVNGLI